MSARNIRNVVAKTQNMNFLKSVGHCHLLGDFHFGGHPRDSKMGSSGANTGFMVRL